jgi:Zn-dependent peptidase ImmA (M78 family)
MSYAAAVQSGIAKSAIYRFGEATAQRLGYTARDDLHDLVARMGGEIDVEDTLLVDPEIAGSLYVDAPGKFRIVVPSHTSPRRDRFTIAHELGHYFLHYLLPRKDNPDAPERVVAFRSGSKRIEWEANWFAAAFLMPEADFKAAFDEFEGDARFIAEHFGVSEAAVRIRAGEVGLAI